MIKITEKISATIGFIIFAFSILSYVSGLIQQPFEKVSFACLSAFALLAAISGLCFAMAQVMGKDDDKAPVLYSGEKLLHSTVLILETIVLKYASETVLSFSFVKSHEIVSSSISWVSYGLLVIISLYATYFLLYGFEALHDFLWSRFQVRRQNRYKNR